MSTFGSPWGDIDDTKAKTPYVVDHDGWGWFFLLVLLAILFFLVGSAMVSISAWICTHPILSILGYSLLSALIGVIFYSRVSMKHRMCGIVAAIGTMLPFEIVIGFYAIPFVMLEGSFSSIFDWFLVAVLLFSSTFFVFSICNLLKNGIIHLIISVVFILLGCCFVLILISSESSLITLDSIRKVYEF